MIRRMLMWIWFRGNGFITKAQVKINNPGQNQREWNRIQIGRQRWKLMGRQRSGNGCQVVRGQDKNSGAVWLSRLSIYVFDWKVSSLILSRISTFPLEPLSPSHRGTTCWLTLCCDPSTECISHGQQGGVGKKSWGFIKYHYSVFFYWNQKNHAHMK